MAGVYFKGEPVSTCGEVPQCGTKLPELWVTGVDLMDVCVSRLESPYTILNVVPSLDTGVCAASAKEFDARAAGLDGLTVCTISRDLPFALSRFQQSEEISYSRLFSSLRNTSFGDALGISLTSGPLAGLLARSVFLLDRHHRLLYAELVQDLSQEPDYSGVLATLESQ